MHERLQDFQWQENAEYAEIICESFDDLHIEMLETMAGLMIDD